MGALGHGGSMCVGRASLWVGRSVAGAAGAVRGTGRPGLWNRRRARHVCGPRPPRCTHGHAECPSHVPLSPWRFVWLAASTVAGGQETGPSISPRLTEC